MFVTDIYSAVVINKFRSKHPEFLYENTNFENPQKLQGPFFNEITEQKSATLLA